MRRSFTLSALTGALVSAQPRRDIFLLAMNEKDEPQGYYEDEGKKEAREEKAHAPQEGHREEAKADLQKEADPRGGANGMSRWRWRASLTCRA